MYVMTKTIGLNKKWSRIKFSLSSLCPDSINLNTPVVPLAHGAGSRFMVDGQRQVLEDMHDAIAVATGDLGLLPGVAFQGRVAQLANLNAAHQTVHIQFIICVFWSSENLGIYWKCLICVKNFLVNDILNWPMIKIIN